MLGRDPIRDPLTSIESSLLAWAIIEHVTAERRPMAEIGLPPSED